MRPMQRRLSRAHFKHLHIRILLPPSQMSKERRTSSTAIHITLTFALQPDSTSHLSETFDSVSSAFLRENCHQYKFFSSHFLAFQDIHWRHPFNLAYNSWRTVAWIKRDPEVLLNFSKCLRKELGWEIHIKDIILETNVQRDLVIVISLGILAYWKGGLCVYRDEIWSWILFNLDAFRNSLSLSW